MKLRLSAPSQIAWIIAVVAGVLGILTEFDVFSIGGLSAFVLVAVGFVILAVATAMKSF
jgi:hypothetical protein